MKTYYGTLNIIEAPQVSITSSMSEMHPDTPTAINNNLELSRLDNELFPMLVTGVSCWPFLTLAFDCNTNQKDRSVFSLTIKLRKKLRNNGGRSIIGPKTVQSLRPYKSMCRKLQSTAKTKDLYEFLSKLKFNGEPSFFKSYKHELNWKKAFKKANGKQAIAYIKAHNDSENDKSVFDVVTLLLKNKPVFYDKTLWYGAFCYAFLRCLFGSFDNNKGESFSYGDYSVKWKNLLLDIMANNKSPIPNNIRNCSKYFELLKRIEDKESKPPLAEITKKWRKDERPVLSGLRLGIFHNLYFHPTPALIERYLER